jgi:chemotaxis protein MotB
MSRRKRRHPEHANHERWLVSYADFITLLFAFFTTLYAISTVDQKKAGKLMYSMRTAFNVEFFPHEATPARSPIGPKIVEIVNAMVGSSGGVGKQPGGEGDRVGRYRAVSDRLQTLGQDAAMTKIVSVREERRGTVVSMAEAGFFESGSATMRPDGHAALARIAAAIGSDGPALDIVVEGHTDDRPVRGRRFASNWELSTARATEVIGLLIREHGFSPDDLAAAGYGEYHPVASNDTTEGRARNRRVDLVVRAPDGADTGQTPTSATH